MRLKSVREGLLLVVNVEGLFLEEILRILRSNSASLVKFDGKFFKK